MDLKDLGYKPIHADAFSQLGRTDIVAARIVRQDRDRFRVRFGTESSLDSAIAEVSGKFRHSASLPSDFPAVGDWVSVTVRADEDAATIHNVLPRISSFSRKVAGDTTREQVVAANVDSIFLVSGMDHDFNLRRIERYVTLAWNSGAQPVIVLNKCDLIDEIESVIIEAEDVAAGLDIIPISAITGEGLSQLGNYVRRGETVALLGSSGAGKSTIVNRLLGEDLLRTAEVRKDDSRGRHTTTSRELFVLPDRGMLIDTPGMRELQLWAGEGSLYDTFSEIDVLAASCRFSDCRHESEPGCSIREALLSGELSGERYNSFLKQRKEIAYLERRKSETDYEERRHDRALGRMYKDVQRHNRKNK